MFRGLGFLNITLYFRRVVHDLKSYRKIRKAERLIIPFSWNSL